MQGQARAHCPTLHINNNTMKEAPEEMTICNLEVLVMPNGEVLCGGVSLGHVKDLGKYLTPKV